MIFNVFGNGCTGGCPIRTDCVTFVFEVLNGVRGVFDLGEEGICRNLKI